MTAAPDGLSPPSLVELATARLREEILSGRLAPGERIVEEQVTARFRTSRAPVREALRLLAEQGLVEHLPRRGARVAVWSPEDIRQLFEVRHALEQYAILSALPLRGRESDADPLAQVRQHLSAMEHAEHAGDALAKDDAHRAFHAAVVGLAGNRQLELVLAPVLLKLQLPMAVNLRREAQAASPERGLARHHALLEALESDDPERVLAALRDHGALTYLPL
ncbi:DNA-binding transcriptional regulator, GntR family [Quadrisphaera granulorum]|uniref:DNA-binding GntR family transcriptional regulator n=1 Tax=Quadrisphaera granulorum TaxID=317664 RepID=A0A315ZXD1_9ACTN|nr:GntR family transcriptional regulator [Quadrisphaera granulorum]PWJ49902.1 DNA-binding GntR family transcriptional regulator [Quadrisphaera granulorum]SZE98110.1 DNA-binding transcriptional regulator, GntR family [Quadrisphaera granulorum]